MAKLTLVRFSLLSLSTYNKKRLINILNIGIFISVFALTAAIVSIYFENSIDKIEKKIIYEEVNKIVIDDNLSQTSRFIKNSDSILENYFSDSNFKILLKESIIDKDFITNRELYYTRYFLLRHRIEVNNSFIEESLKNGILIADEEIDLLFLKEFRKKYRGLKSLEEDINFKRNINDNELEPDKNKDGSWNEKINKRTIWYKSYEVLIKDQIELIKLQRNFFYDFNLEFLIRKNSENDERKKLYSKNIKKKSKNEANFIFAAFIIQLIIFLISQFFEFTLDNLIKRKHAKRK